MTTEYDNGEVIVIGYRLAPDTSGGGGGGVLNFQGFRASRDAPEPQPYETVADSDVVTVSKHPLLGPLNAEQRAAVNELMATYYEWVGYLQSIPAGTVFYFPDGTTATASEVLQNFLHTDFVLYPAGHNFGNSGAGAANYNSGNPILGIAIDQLVQNMASNDATAWYFTHELAHITASGRAFNGAMYASTSPGGTTVLESEWMANEQFANSLGDAIARASGHVFGASWVGAPHGYYGTVSWTTTP